MTIQIEKALELLNNHQVEFVVIGGVAISAHGSSYLTFDLDLCYSRTNENFRRIATALAPYNPRPRDFPKDSPFD